MFAKTKNLTPGSLKINEKKPLSDAPSPNNNTDKSNCDSTKNRSKNSEATQMYVDGYQQQQFHNFYNSYIEVLENINISKPELVKRSFEQYMDVIEDNYIEKMNGNICNKIKELTNDNINNVIPVEYVHSKNEMLETLGTEFYVFFKILDLHWKQRDVKKKDILLLSPCKIFLLQSIIKRKYNDELDFK